MVYAVIAGKMGAWAYKAGVGVALVAGFALEWYNMVRVRGLRKSANCPASTINSAGALTRRFCYQ